MIDITEKKTTLRSATAVSHVIARHDTLHKIEQGQVPKGDVWATSRTAGIMAVKNTSQTLPLCHPLSVEHAEVSFEADNEQGIIAIKATVSGIAKTGFEMEALHGAMAAALNIYDMLKPIDKSLSIEKTYLLEKRGGKSEYLDKAPKSFKAAVIVCSDSISNGSKHDKAGNIIREKLTENGVETQHYEVIPDEIEEIQIQVKALIDHHYDLVIITGGTGLSPRDVTPEAIRPLLDKEVPGIMEASREYGMERTPYAMLSRGVAGVKDKTLILTLPGSSRGAEESMDALFPALLHSYGVLRMARHEKG